AFSASMLKSVRASWRTVLGNKNGLITSARGAFQGTVSPRFVTSRSPTLLAPRLLLDSRKALFTRRVEAQVFVRIPIAIRSLVVVDQKIAEGNEFPPGNLWGDLVQHTG